MNKDNLKPDSLLAHLEELEAGANRIFAITDDNNVKYTFTSKSFIVTQTLDGDVISFNWDDKKIVVKGVSGEEYHFSWELRESDEHWAN